MKRFFYLLIVLSFSVSSPAQVTMMNDVSPEYLDKLIALAQANYPKFKATAAKVNSAKANYIKAKRGIFDFATFNYVYYPGNTLAIYNGSTVSSFLGGYQAGLFVNVGSILQKPSNIKQAKEEWIASGYEKEVTDLNLVAEVKKRYYAYIQAINVLKLRTQVVSDATDVLKNVKYRFEKGEVALEIYNQALLSLSTNSSEKIAAEANLLIAKSSLEELLGTTLENIK